MYESPIEIITKQIRTQSEDNVFKVIQEQGIFVNKEELVKALEYDRNQYQKGYADGLLNNTNNVIDEFAERLKKRLYNKPSIFTQQRYIVVDEIDSLVEEMKRGADNEQREAD
jgi:hypothetical protein